MYYLNKIVGWCLSPMGVLFLGLCLGIGLRRLRGSRSLGAWVIGATLVAFWILGCGVTTRVIGVPLEGEEVGRVEHVDRVDAIVLLGGGMGAHEKCGRAEMFGGADRVWMAAKLWKKASGCLGSSSSGAPRIAPASQLASLGGYSAEYSDSLARTPCAIPLTLSGGNVRVSTVPLLKDLGVPEEAMMFFPEARNTEEEARLIKEKLTHHCPPQPFPSTSKPKVLLVTSAWHMPRAKMLFERVGFEVIDAPCDYEMHYAAEEPIKFGDFFPNAEALQRNSYAIKEWVARAGYRLLRRQ